MTDTAPPMRDRADSKKITINLSTASSSRCRKEVVRAAGETLHIKVVGLVRIAPDVTAELALATIASLTVLGALQARPKVGAALKARTRLAIAFRARQ